MKPYQYVSDKYGSEPVVYETLEQFQADAHELGLTELSWHTDGEHDYYTDQDGDVVLEEIN